MNLEKPRSKQSSAATKWCARLLRLSTITDNVRILGMPRLLQLFLLCVDIHRLQRILFLDGFSWPSSALMRRDELSKRRL